MSDKLSKEEAERRMKALSTLQIDIHNRFAEMLQFNEHCADAIDNFKQVVKLCEMNMLNNERVYLSAIFNMGMCHSTS
jgi:hypothetical protein